MDYGEHGVVGFVGEGGGSERESDLFQGGVAAHGLRLCGRATQAESCTDRYSSQFKKKLLHINVQWFRGGLVFEAHRLLYHSA